MGYVESEGVNASDYSLGDLNRFWFGDMIYWKLVDGRLVERWDRGSKRGTTVEIGGCERNSANEPESLGL